MPRYKQGVDGLLADIRNANALPPAQSYCRPPGKPPGQHLPLRRAQVPRHVHETDRAARLKPVSRLQNNPRLGHRGRRGE